MATQNATGEAASTYPTPLSDRPGGRPPPTAHALPDAPRPLESIIDNVNMYCYDGYDDQACCNPNTVAAADLNLLRFSLFNMILNFN